MKPNPNPIDSPLSKLQICNLRPKICQNGLILTSTLSTGEKNEWNNKLIHSNHQVSESRFANISKKERTTTTSTTVATTTWYRYVESKFVRPLWTHRRRRHARARFELHEVMRCALEGVGRRGIGVVEEERPSTALSWRLLCSQSTSYRFGNLVIGQLLHVYVTRHVEAIFKFASQIPL